MSLVVVGSVAYDGVETPHGRVDRMLGGAATYISLSSSFFTKTNLVGIVGDDFAQEDTDLLVRHGIDLEGLERVPGKTFFWAGKYSPDMNDRETLVTDLNVFADFNPKLPEAYKTSPYVLLGNIQPALQKSVRAPRCRAYVKLSCISTWSSHYRIASMHWKRKSTRQSKATIRSLRQVHNSANPNRPILHQDSLATGLLNAPIPSISTET